MPSSGSMRAGTTWLVPLVAFASLWEVAARVAQRPRLFPTLLDTLGSVPALASWELAGAALNSIVDVLVGFAAAALLSQAAGALMKQWGGALPGLRIFVWLASIFLSLTLARLALGGLGGGPNAVYIVGGAASFLLMLALLSSGASGPLVVNLGFLGAWVGALGAEASLSSQTLGVLVQRAGQSGPLERFYALCLLAAVLGLALAEVVGVVSARLSAGRPGGRK